MASGNVEVCANCGKEMPRSEQAYAYENDVVCLECYNRLKKQGSYSSPPFVESAYQGTAVAGPQPTQPAQVPAAISFPEFAGFWRRFAAAFIDGIILNLTIGLMLGLAWGATTGTTEAGEVLNPLFRFIWIVIVWLYYALMESSSKQATLGKMAIGITVTDMNGDRISFGRATGRHFAKFISLLTLCVGYIMAGFTEKKQALHDMITSCLVVQKL